MKHGKWIALLLAMAMIIGLTGCSNNSEQTGGTPAASAGGGAEASADPKDVKIGILIPGSPTDGGFCQQAAEAGRNLQEKYGYPVSVVEVSTTESMKSEAENMAADGYRIVFGHGGQFSAPFLEICANYPETWFITVGGTETSDNLFPLCMCLEEGTYVSGIVAGMLTKSNIIGFSVAGDFPAYMKTPMGWALGAKSVNPNLEVKSTVLNSPDSNEAYETTMNQIQAGADMIYSNTNAGQSGSIKAVNESEGVYTFGSLGNFTDLGPECVLMNIIGNYTMGYEKAALAVIEGTAKQEIMYLTLADGAIDIIWNETLKAELPDEVLEAVAQTQADIISGKIDVPNEYEQEKAQELLRS